MSALDYLKKIFGKRKLLLSYEFARDWGKIVHKAEKVTLDGEVYLPEELHYLSGIRVPARITWSGHWSVFPVPGYGIDEWALRKSVEHPTHYLYLECVHDSRVPDRFSHRVRSESA
jgi:hypothetical protein